MIASALRADRPTAWRNDVPERRAVLKHETVPPTITLQSTARLTMTTVGGYGTKYEVAHTRPLARISSQRPTVINAPPRTNFH
jgi:hypothetical protein